MPKFAANLSMMFTEHPFLDRFGAAAAAGFRAVEFLFPYEYAVSDLAERLTKAGLDLALFNMPPGEFSAGDRGLAAVAGREAEFEAGIAKALAYAQGLGCRKLHVMAGLAEGTAAEDIFVANLRLAGAAAAGTGVTLLIEPINSRDMPGYFLSDVNHAADLIDRIGLPNVRLQLDIYHRQIMRGDLAACITTHAQITHHFQIANPPDRGEPDAGEINFRSVFDMIDASGYDDWVGCEYRPRRGTLEGLAWTTKLGVML